MSQFKNFSNAQVVYWVMNNFPGKGKIKDDLVKLIKENELSGSDLATAKSSDDFKNQCGMPPIAANKLFTALSQGFPTEFGAGAKAANTTNRIDNLLKQNRKTLVNRHDNDEGNGNNSYKNDKSFKVALFVGSKRKLTHNWFTINSSVLALKREIAQNESGGNPTGCDVRLIYNSKPLDENKTLGSYGIKNSACWVTAIVRLVGGAQAVYDENNNKTKFKGKNLLDNGKNSDTRERIAHFDENKRLIPTLAPDCVTYEDSQDELRVKMPCGHVFSPLTIFKWCQRTLEVYSKSEVRCPMLKCNKKWEVNDIVTGGDLDKVERASLVNILSHRELMQSGDFKECPECEALVELPDEVYICRVRCTTKECRSQGKPDFCWLCNQTWRGSGLAICGNKDCHSASINDLLKIKNCGATTEVMGREDVKCPKLRACPRCLSITEFKRACKHMVCWNCKRSFCFVCLALAGKEINGYGYEWACDGGDNYKGSCKLAPVQVLK